MATAAAPKALTKAQIIAQLAEKNGLTKKQVAAFLDSFADLAYKETKKNKKFTIPGVGILKLNKRKARMGRNPATGEAIKIPPRPRSRSPFPRPARKPSSAPSKTARMVESRLGPPAGFFYARIGRSRQPWKERRAS